MAYGDRAEAELMRWLLVVAFLASCAPAAAAPVQTEDPRVAVLSAQVADLIQQVQTLTAQRDVALATQLAAAREANTQVDIWYSMWNTPLDVEPGHYLAAGLPDTFAARITFKATQPVRAMIMSFDQFVQYKTGGVPNPTEVFPATTNLDVTVHEAEGCAGYILVLDAASTATVTPDIMITRRSSPVRTGVCAN